MTSIDIPIFFSKLKTNVSLSALCFCLAALSKCGMIKKQQQITRRAKKNVLFNEGKTKPIGLVTSPFRLPQCVRVCARACRLVSKKEKQILVGFFSPKKKKKTRFFPLFHVRCCRVLFHYHVKGNKRKKRNQPTQRQPWAARGCRRSP